METAINLPTDIPASGDKPAELVGRFRDSKKPPATLKAKLDFLAVNPTGIILRLKIT